MLFQAKAASGHHQIEPTAAIDIRVDYVANNGAPSAAAPKIFFRTTSTPPPERSRA